MRHAAPASTRICPQSRETALRSLAARALVRGGRGGQLACSLRLESGSAAHTRPAPAPNHGGGSRRARRCICDPMGDCGSPRWGTAGRALRSAAVHSAPTSAPCAAPAASSSRPVRRCTVTTSSRSSPRSSSSAGPPAPAEVAAPPRSSGAGAVPAAGSPAAGPAAAPALAPPSSARVPAPSAAAGGGGSTSRAAPALPTMWPLRRMTASSAAARAQHRDVARAHGKSRGLGRGAGRDAKVGQPQVGALEQRLTRPSREPTA